MSYLLIFLLFIQLPVYAEWSHEYDFVPDLYKDSGCYEMYDCVKRKKLEGYDIMNGVAIAGCEKEDAECSQILNKRTEEAKRQAEISRLSTPAYVPYFIPYPIFINRN